MIERPLICLQMSVLPSAKYPGYGAAETLQPRQDADELLQGYRIKITLNSHLAAAGHKPQGSRLFLFSGATRSSINAGLSGGCSLFFQYGNWRRLRL